MARLRGTPRGNSEFVRQRKSRKATELWGKGEDAGATSKKRNLWKGQLDLKGAKLSRGNRGGNGREREKLFFSLYSPPLHHTVLVAAATYSFHVDAMHSRQGVHTALQNDGNIQRAHFYPLQKKRR